MGGNSDIFEFENILMAVDPLGQTFRLAYLHQKWINFIEIGKNNNRSPKADLKKAYLFWKIPKKCVYSWNFGWCLRATFNSDFLEKLRLPPPGFSKFPN